MVKSSKCLVSHHILLDPRNHTTDETTERQFDTGRCFEALIIPTPHTKHVRTKQSSYQNSGAVGQQEVVVVGHGQIQILLTSFGALQEKGN